MISPSSAGLRQATPDCSSSWVHRQPGVLVRTPAGSRPSGPPYSSLSLSRSSSAARSRPCSHCRSGRGNPSKRCAITQSTCSGRSPSCRCSSSASESCFHTDTTGREHRFPRRNDALAVTTTGPCSSSIRHPEIGRKRNPELNSSWASSPRSERPPCFPSLCRPGEFLGDGPVRTAKDRPVVPCRWGLEPPRTSHPI